MFQRGGAGPLKRVLSSAKKLDASFQTKVMKSLYTYHFNGIFSLKSNIPYFEGMLHSFRAASDERGGSSSTLAGTTNDPTHAPPLALEFIQDDSLEVSPSGKEKVNLMLYHDRESEAIEFLYPWFRPVCARLEAMKSLGRVGFRFTFNKRYLTFSNIVAEGWELIDQLRSLLLLHLIRDRRMYMFHAAAVKLGDGDGILIPAFGNTGKTTTSWMLAKQHQLGAKFLTDEFAIVDSSGYCYGLPCSSVISSVTVKKFDIKLSRSQRVSMSISDLKSKLLSTRFSPGGVKIYPDRIFETSPGARINKLAIIQNGVDAVKTLNRKEALKRIKAIQDYEFGWKSNPYLLAESFFNNDLDISSVSAIENDFLNTFLASIDDIYLVSSSKAEHYKAILEEILPKSTTATHR